MLCHAGLGVIDGLLDEFDWHWDWDWDGSSVMMMMMMEVPLEIMMANNSGSGSLTRNSRVLLDAVWSFAGDEISRAVEPNMSLPVCFDGVGGAGRYCLFLSLVWRLVLD